MRPARGNDLGARIEGDSFGPADVRVAEERLPATKGIVGHRHRDRHVDDDHPDCDAALKFSGDRAASKPDEAKKT